MCARPPSSLRRKTTTIWDEGALMKRNRNARKHGRFTKVAIAERKQIEALLGEARKLLQEMK
jgi:hypothetical protein